MKKSTVFIGAILSLIPLGHPLIIKTGIVLYTTGLILSIPEKAQADSAEFFTNRGNKKGVSGDHYGAIADYNKAIEINPNYDSAYVNRGATKMTLKNYYGALADYNKAIEINPSDGTYYTVRGWIKNILGDFKLACNDFRKGSYLGDKVGTKAFERYCQ